MLPGLQVAHGYLIGARLLADLKGFGYRVIRIEQGATPALTRQLAQEVLDAGLTPLVILFQAEHAKVIPQGAWVEVENEPDLGFPDRATCQRGPMSAEQVIGLALAVDVHLPTSIPVFAPAVSNLNARGFNMLQAVVPWLPDRFGVSAHRYPNGDTRLHPHEGFASREQEMERLFQVAGSRRDVAITEVGYHTGPRPHPHWLMRLFRRKVRWSDLDVKRMWEEEWRFMEDMDHMYGGRLKAVVKYNVNDGPDGDNPLHRYGIRDYPGMGWKVSAPVR